jgi:hypothetical protein
MKRKKLYLPSSLYLLSSFDSADKFGMKKRAQAGWQSVDFYKTIL